MGFLEGLRSGAWLTRERIRLVAVAMLAAMLLGAVYLVGTSDGLNDRFGRPLGADSLNVYAAGTYVLDGQPTAPFDSGATICPRAGDIRRRPHHFTAGITHPSFWLLAAPLAAMPYWLALLVLAGRDAGFVCSIHQSDFSFFTLPCRGRGVRRRRTGWGARAPKQVHPLPGELRSPTSPSRGR